MRYYSLLRVGINMQANFGEKEAQMRSTEALLALRLSNFQKHIDTSHAG